MILDNGDSIRSGAKPPADLLAKMVQGATAASQMLQQAAGGGRTTASNYSSLSGANALPATNHPHHPHHHHHHHPPHTIALREDTKEGIVDASPGGGGANTVATGTGSPSVNTTHHSSAPPPVKKQVCLLVHFLFQILHFIIFFLRKRNKPLHLLSPKSRTRIRDVWGVMRLRHRNGDVDLWVRREWDSPFSVDFILLIFPS